MVLVQAQQDARALVAEMVDDAVVQTAVARAGVEADIGHAKAAEHLGRDVAAPGDVLVRPSINSVELHLATFPKARVRRRRLRFRRARSRPPPSAEARVRPARTVESAALPPRRLRRQEAFPSPDLLIT